MLACRYTGDLYRVLVHGQDAQRERGSTPTSGLNVCAAATAGIAIMAVGVALMAG